jgi:hypothetical protein
MLLLFDIIKKTSDLCINNSVCGSPRRFVLHFKKDELGFSIIAKSRFF